MSQEDLHNHAAIPTAENQRVDESGSGHRSGATVMFWILVVLLAFLGLCVVMSILLAIVNGS